MLSHILSVVFAALAGVLLTCSVVAQETPRGQDLQQQGQDPRLVTNSDKGPSRRGLNPGEKVTDSNGVSVQVDGAATPSTGSLQITYSGTATEQPRGSGCYVVSGSIQRVVNLRSGGVSGLITIDTAGNFVEVYLLRTGPSAQNPVMTTVSGGNASVEIGVNSSRGATTQNNSASVSGSGNTVTFNNSSNNSVTGEAGSSGTVNYNVPLTGTNNTFNAVGGSTWMVTTS